MKHLYLTLLLLCAFLSPKGYAQFSFTVSSPSGNFSLTCGNPTLNLTVTSNTAAVSYTWTKPSSATATGSALAVTSPGVYTITATSGAATTTGTVAIYLNTTPPDNNFNTPTAFTLSCGTPTVQIQNPSATANATYSWSYAGAPATATLSSLTVSANLAAPPSNTLTGTFTLTITDPANQCTSTKVIRVYQNLYPPKANIGAGGSALTCSTPSITLTNMSSSGVPPGIFFTPLGIIGFQWIGPAPQPSLTNTSFYQAYTPGTYTLVAKDLNNGCTASTVTTIADNRIYPVVNYQYLSILPCPGFVTLASYVSGAPASSMTFLWSSPVNANVSGANTATLTTDAPGFYTLTVTSNQTSCTTSVVVSVWACVGIEDHGAALSSVRVFPNPASSQLYVESDQALSDGLELSMTNALGQIVYTATCTTLSQAIDITHLKAGIYSLSIKASEGQKVVKVIKE